MFGSIKKLYEFIRWTNFIRKCGIYKIYRDKDGNVLEIDVFVGDDLIRFKPEETIKDFKKNYQYKFSWVRFVVLHVIVASIMQAIMKLIFRFVKVEVETL